MLIKIEYLFYQSHMIGCAKRATAFATILMPALR